MEACVCPLTPPPKEAHEHRSWIIRPLPEAAPRRVRREE